MKMKLLARAFTISLMFLSYGCADKNHANNNIIHSKTRAGYKKINFENFIEKHKNDVLDFYDGLLMDKPFVGILEHSNIYFDDVVSFLNKQRFNNIQAAICVCAMQNLDLADYVKLCNFYLLLYKKKLINEGMIEHVIAPDFLRKRIIVNNYGNPEVIKLINSIEQEKTITNTNFREWLPKILSGESSRELREVDEDSGS